MNLEQTRNSSRSFYMAFHRNMEQRPLINGQIQFLVVPAVVCAAFSIELGLKALLLQSGKKASGHKLKELFGSLDSSSQKQLVALAGIDESCFALSLEKANNTFVDWRYIYERDSANADIDFLSKLAGALQSVIVQSGGLQPTVLPDAAA